MKIAIIGLGYWGPNLVRNFITTEGVDGVVCWDLQPKKMERIKKRFPSVETVETLEEILTDPEIAGVAVATPVSTHHEIGMKVLGAGKHLLLEKPMAASSREARELVEAASKKGVVLAVDHTFIYTGAVRKIKELLESGKIGEILYFDSVRVNLGLFQHDANVVWDLATHDLSIMHHLIGMRPVGVSAVGVSHFNGHEDMAYLTVHFSDKLLAHFHVNWLSPVKVRKILIGGSRQMVVYDDMEASDKVKVYDKGVSVNGEESVYRALVQYRTGDMFAPHLDQTEALTLLAREFVDCIQNGKPPAVDGMAGLEVVQILEAADLSMKNGGEKILLSTLSEA